MTRFRDRRRSRWPCSRWRCVLRPLWRDRRVAGARRRRRRSRWPPALLYFARRHAGARWIPRSAARRRRWTTRSAQLEAELAARSEPARRLAPARRAPTRAEGSASPRRATPTRRRVKLAPRRSRPAGRSRGSARAGRAGTPLRRRSRRAAARALQAQPHAPARALVPRHRPTPGRQPAEAAKTWEPLLADRRCAHRRRACARRSMPRAPRPACRRCRRRRADMRPALTAASKVDARRRRWRAKLARRRHAVRDRARRPAARRCRSRSKSCRAQRLPGRRSTLDDGDSPMPTHEAVAARATSKCSHAFRPAAMRRRSPATGIRAARPRGQGRRAIDLRIDRTSTSA